MAKIAVIGAGMMGSAIITGVVKNEVLDPEDIYISDPDTEKVKRLQALLGTNPAASNAEAVEGADVILIAVKPQFLADAMHSVRDIVSDEALVMTIVAGVPVSYYLHELDVKRVVRIMPNTPAQVGEGVCAWFATDGVSIAQKELVQKILASLGVEFEVKRETDLDLVTAVSGSGPAYVYLFIESMVDAAVQMGLPRPLSEKIVLQTVYGSAAYMKHAEKHPVILKNEVTSPGGTTAAALAAMEKEGLRTAVTEGMLACLRKTIELGKKQ